jgi:pilus assembly protein Flp/PilA
MVRGDVASDESGVTAIEYALIGSLLALAILVGVGGVGLELEALYLRVCNAVVGAIGGGSC